MPSPIYHCTTIADLQRRLARINRLYPELRPRVTAAGVLIAADAIKTDLDFELFLVRSALGQGYLINLLDGSCTCPDHAVPIVRDTKLCEHTIACLIVHDLAGRAEVDFWSRPRPSGAARWQGMALFADGGVFSYDDARVERPVDDAGPNRRAWSASSPGRCAHPAFIDDGSAVRCLVCDARLDYAQDPDTRSEPGWGDTLDAP
jgi:hypothetical protein